MTPTLTSAPPVATIRQTYLIWILSKCQRGAKALIDGAEGPSYGGAARGSGVHEFFAAYNRHLYVAKRETDWTYAQVLLLEVLSDYPELNIPEREDVAAQAKTITDTYILDREHYYGSEEFLEYDLVLPGGRVVTITGTLDLLLVDGGTATVLDCKSNHALPPDSAIAKDLQLTIYALLVFREMPHIETVKGQLWFTRYGKLLPRKDEVLWTREDIDRFEGHLKAILPPFLDATHHEAIPGSHCQYCPLRRVGRCTLWRSYYGVTPAPILTREDFQKRGRQLIVLEQRFAILKDQLKAWVTEHGPEAIGSGEYAEVFAFRTSETEEIGASDLLELLEDNRDLIGEQPLDKLLSVRRDSKAYKSLRYHAELRSAFEDKVRMVPGSSIFGHKRPEGGRMISCPGLRHDSDGGDYYCSVRPCEWPENDDWDAWCRQCLESRETADDQAIDMAQGEALW